jgi:pilus assembly protein Flp/PilA
MWYSGSAGRLRQRSHHPPGVTLQFSGKEGLPMLFAQRERGQGLVEYALILVLVAVVVIVILALLGPAIGNVFSNLVANI